MFSVLILTRNEEATLPGCLRSVAWCDDVVVLDSFSTDVTLKVAQAGGARVYQRAFDDFATQRNYSLDHIPFRHPWVFHLDADEHFTEPLLGECMRAIKDERFSGFMVSSKLMFMGRWLRYAGMYPAYQMRLLKLGEVRFRQHGHGQRESDPKHGIGKLAEPYLHFNFSKGIADWLEKHNRYSSQEAVESLKSGVEGQRSELDLVREVVLAQDSLARRRALKELSWRLPCRPALRFLYMYVLRRGFLDGSPGYRYCRLLAIYEYLIVIKGRELRKERKVEG